MRMTYVQKVEAIQNVNQLTNMQIGNSMSLYNGKILHTRINDILFLGMVTHDFRVPALNLPILNRDFQANIELLSHTHIHTKNALITIYHNRDELYIDMLSERSCPQKDILYRIPVIVWSGKGKSL